MKIKWLGHSCFLITAGSGRTLLTDPFDGETGYWVPGATADVVTASHKHSDHHATELLPGGFTLIDQPGVHHACGLVIEGIGSFHDDEAGLKRGGNIIYVTEIDGLRIAHMGDLGHQLSEAQLEKLGEIDLMLVPVGGRFTLDCEGAAKVVGSVKPRIAVPMHYMTEDLNADRFENVTDEKAFANAFEHRYLGENEMELTRENIGNHPEVVVMDYHR